MCFLSTEALKLFEIWILPNVLLFIWSLHFLTHLYERSQFLLRFCLRIEKNKYNYIFFSYCFCKVSSVCCTFQLTTRTDDKWWKLRTWIQIHCSCDNDSTQSRWGHGRGENTKLLKTSFTLNQLSTRNIDNKKKNDKKI